MFMYLVTFGLGTLDSCCFPSFYRKSNNRAKWAQGSEEALLISNDVLIHLHTEVKCLWTEQVQMERTWQNL